MMTREEIMKLAENYMNNRKVEIVLPGEFGQIHGDFVEVIFLVPEALDPNCVVDPPDNRVWVNTKTKEITWIEQM